MLMGLKESFLKMAFNLYHMGLLDKTESLRLINNLEGRKYLPRKVIQKNGSWTIANIITLQKEEDSAREKDYRIILEAPEANKYSKKN